MLHVETRQFPTPSRAVGISARPLLALSLLVSMAGAAPPNPPQGLDLSDIAPTLVQDGGRLKPLESFARETVTRITGSERLRPRHDDTLRDWKGQASLAVLLSWSFEPEPWHDVRLIRVLYRPLKQEIGLDPDRQAFSFDELAGNDALRALEQGVQEGIRHQGDAFQPTQLEREVLDVMDRLRLLDEVWQGAAPLLVPPADTPQGKWISVVEIPADSGRAGDMGVQRAWDGLREAFRSGDQARFRDSSKELRAALDQLHVAIEGPAAVRTSQSRALWEIHYHRARPFRWSSLCCGLSLAILFVSWFWLKRTTYWAGMAVLALGIGLQAYGLALRLVVSGRSPVANMYESLLFMGFALALIGAGIEIACRIRYLGVSAAAGSVLLLLLADALPLGQGFEPLRPVLRSNYWLTIHVLTIMAGYAGLTLAMGLGHLVLALFLFAPRQQGILDQMSQFLYRCLQIGFLLMTAGTVLGAWWAGEAWGRYWGWDPKETWSLIVILGYGILLHGRSAGYWGPFGMALGCVLAWSLVFICYYGVNFLLASGLHSYGFGAGGFRVAILYLAVEVAVVAFAVYGRAKRSSSRATTR